MRWSKRLGKWLSGSSYRNEKLLWKVLPEPFLTGLHIALAQCSVAAKLVLPMIFLLVTAHSKGRRLNEYMAIFGA